MEPGQDQFARKIGSTMTLLAWLAVIAVLTVLFSAYLDKRANPNTSIESRIGGSGIEIMLERNRNGHYVATAMLNSVPVDVMVDTGATEVSVPARVAVQAGLKRGPAFEVSTANGNIEVYATRIDTIQLGDLVLHDVRANINPAMQENIVLLGMSFLRRVEFSQQQGKLILKHTR